MLSNGSMSTTGFQFTLENPPNPITGVPLNQLHFTGNYLNQTMMHNVRLPPPSPRPTFFPPPLAGGYVVPSTIVTIHPAPVIPTTIPFRTWRLASTMPSPPCFATFRLQWVSQH
ncbi:hypothetical protein L6452_34684 [Arctium lappa]|uniref:Uncharacterized protein n=1 Tax=Arctium lappa TaxID=4217 RepID=A0ACB8YIW1_ARCLA|nr:hypothetical protein L6452_34684 [Arctium lappa]